MSTVQSAMAVCDLAGVNEVIAFAKRVQPDVPAPDLGDGLCVEVYVHLHRVPVDVLHAALAVNDDLPWGTITRYADERYGGQYWSVAAKLRGTLLVLFSEHQALSANVASGEHGGEV